MARTRASAAVFAAKMYSADKVRPADVERAGVLSELRALLRVNAGWQAVDALDERWCPLVQLHGLFYSPRVGLLMERFGVSLYSMLRDADQRAAFERFNRAHADEGAATIAANVASACRYLHDIGMMHRDLKVRPSRAWPARWVAAVHCGGG